MIQDEIQEYGASQILLKTGKVIYEQQVPSFTIDS